MYALVDGELETQLADPHARARWVVLDRHPDFPGHWIVEGFCSDYLYDLGEILGSYRALAPAGLGDFLEAAGERGYNVAFFEDPTKVLDQFVHLNTEPEIEINSTFENTVKGMLPYQVQGYNMLKDLDYGVARWDTGTGKTVLATALIQYHLKREAFDLCFVVVKKNNKVNTVRKLKKLGGVDALYVRGSKQRREKYYRQMRHWAGRAHEFGKSRVVVVLNYEQFKHDFVTRDKDKMLILSEWGNAFFNSSLDVMCIWDEMPMKLKTRTSELYKAICKCLYRTAPPQVKSDRIRPRSLRSYMLSATPIENTPEDWFNCLRLLDGGKTYGTVDEFNDAYVKTWSLFDEDKPEEFHNFERMRLKVADRVHQVSKDDPDIAAVFPKVVPELMYIDWDERNALIYNEVQDLASGVIEHEGFANVPIFSLIGTLQMICDMPEMVNDSAARRAMYEDAFAAWEESPEGRPPKKNGSEFALELPDKLRSRLTNENHPKLEKLRELLMERHPDDQVAIYTKFNKTQLPYLETMLREWGITYGSYIGTEKQQQAVQDAFQAGDIRIFLSPDSGSDSIDLDAGNVVIDYNMPWKWTTITQRHNRIHRPTSTHDTVFYYTLIMEGSVEERVLQIIEQKHGYHNALFNPAGGDLSASARLSKEDLAYILTGQ